MGALHLIVSAWLLKLRLGDTGEVFSNALMIEQSGGGFPKRTEWSTKRRADRSGVAPAVLAALIDSEIGFKVESDYARDLQSRFESKLKRPYM